MRFRQPSAHEGCLIGGQGFNSTERWQESAVSDHPMLEITGGEPRIHSRECGDISCEKSNFVQASPRPRFKNFKPGAHVGEITNPHSDIRKEIGAPGGKLGRGSRE